MGYLLQFPEMEIAMREYKGKSVFAVRPYKEFKYKPAIQAPGLAMAGNMTGKWQYLIAMNQQTIINIQRKTIA